MESDTPFLKTLPLWSLSKVLRPPLATLLLVFLLSRCLFFQENKADAITLDGGLVFEAGQAPYKLRPVAAEVYGTEARELSPGGLWL